MLALFQLPRRTEGPAERPVIGRRSLFEATKFIQEMINDTSVWGPDRVAGHQHILDGAQAGDPERVAKAERLVRDILEEYSLEVPGMTVPVLAYEIYKYAWGLDVLEALYRDPAMDEIRVNGPSMVFVQRRGRNERTGVEFKDEEHLKKIMARLFVHDRGVALTSSTPAAESVRLDGTRVTATCPPVTRTWTMVLRKHDTFDMTPENLIRHGTLNRQLLDLILLLVKGRANIMLSGGVGSGKTSFLRFLIRYLPESLRVLTLESDRELRLLDHYPDRDVVEFEEHKDLGYPIDQEFRLVLRYTPDVIIVGEVRGHGEATQAVDACTRGHDGSMVTVHFSSPEEAITGYTRMMLKEGASLPVDIATAWVGKAFNIIIQFFSDTTRGIKKIVRVVEVTEQDGAVATRDLAVWRHTPGDYMTGRWVFPDSPSAGLVARLERYGVTRADMDALYHQEARVVGGT